MDRCDGWIGVMGGPYTLMTSRLHLLPPKAWAARTTLGPACSSSEPPTDLTCWTQRCYVQVNIWMCVLCMFVCMHVGCVCVCCVCICSLKCGYLPSTVSLGLNLYFASVLSWMWYIWHARGIAVRSCLIQMQWTQAHTRNFCA